MSQIKHIRYTKHHNVIKRTTTRNEAENKHLIVRIPISSKDSRLLVHHPNKVFSFFGGEGVIAKQANY